MMTLTFPLAFLACLAVVSITTTLGAGDEGLYVNITILQKATAEGAVCLDGSPPAYHLHPGHGSGLNSWIIVLDAGGWCSSIPDCLDRSAKYSGSSKYMDHRAYFAGILSNISEENPEFYNWNRVRVKYCDGSSFTGDVEQVDPDNKLYFRGSRIFKAIMEDLWSKGMQNAENPRQCNCPGVLMCVGTLETWKSGIEIYTIWHQEELTSVITREVDRVSLHLVREFEKRDQPLGP